MTDFDCRTVRLNDGRDMPQLGFGTYKIASEEAPRIVGYALDAGYRLVDTAEIYSNEAGIGTALADRPDIWLTTKIWNDWHGYAAALGAFERSLERLGRESVDLLLIHWPCPPKDNFVETWKALVELHNEGRAKSIGVSNFRVQDLEKLADSSGTLPVVNQIELHPRFQQHELRKLHAEMGIVTQCWSPLGQGDSMSEKVIAGIAEETGAPAAAVILAWHMHHGLAPIPKSATRSHIADNFIAETLSLTEDQVARIDALDTKDGRIGPDPATFVSLN